MNMAPAAESHVTRCGRRPAFRQSVVRIALAIAMAWATAASMAEPAAAVDEAQAAKGPPFHINVLLSSRKDVCYDPGDVAAIKALTLKEQERINRHGGVSGRPVRLKFLDDARQEAGVIANLRAAIDDPQSLAIVGLLNATRAKAALDTLGPDLLKSGVPFLSDIAVNNLFSAFPNVYSTRASQDTDSIPVMAKFTQQLGLARAGFIGLKDSVSSAALGDGLRAELGEGGLIADVRLGVEKDKLLAGRNDGGAQRNERQAPGRDLY